MWINRLQLMIIAALITGGLGCATMYEGEPPVGEEAATVEGSLWGSLRYYKAAITGIDEKDFGFRPVASAKILPGHHTVTARCYRGWSTLAGVYGGQPTLEFIAVGGHKYQVRCKFVGPGVGTQWMWIEDKTTGEVVAGNRPN